MQFATPGAARGALNTALTGPAPAQAMGRLLAGGALAPFGVPPVLAAAPLDKVPEGLLCRWWAFLHLAGLGPAEAAGAFGLGGSFLADLGCMQRLFAAGPAPSVQALKLQLAGGLPFDYGDAARTFAVMDGRFAGTPALYRRLVASGQPYTVAQLAATGAEAVVTAIFNTFLDCLKALSSDA